MENGVGIVILLQLAIEVRGLRLVIRSSTVADLPKTFCIYKQDTLIIKIRQLSCNIGRSLMSSPISAAETKPRRTLRRGNSGRVSTESQPSSIRRSTFAGSMTMNSNEISSKQLGDRTVVCREECR